MKPFRFRLDRVLRVREVEEETARAAWLVVEQAARAAETRAEARAHDRGEAFSELAREMAECSLAPAVMLVRHAVLDRLARAESEERERALTLRRQADQARGPWQDRRREVLGLTRLRTVAKSRYADAALAKEIAEMDEVALMRAASRRRASRRRAEHETAPPDVPAHVLSERTDDR
ncbi:MAG: hypothetical protein E2O39_07605 [Planctomycetota bacterium]|nr:MAG: hypothetical protein E2O39_07605 [Planctomycetota bacterium]